MAEYIEREAIRYALYDADAITMNGVKQINQLISEYSGKPIPKVEVGYERFNA